MDIFQKLTEFGKKQSFQPNIFSIFLNPFFFVRKGLYQEIKKKAPHLRGKMLDFGCGRKPYKQLFSVDEYIGVDMAESGHSHAETEVDVFYNGKEIPIEDAYFDTVFSSEVFEHVFNLDEILSEINRVLKMNGIGLITVPFSWAEHEIPYDCARYTSFGIKYILEKHGFEVVEQEKTGHFAEVIIQMFILYIFSLFSSRNRYINTVLTIVFISPFNLLGLLFSYVLPRKKVLYHNNVVVFKKVR